MYPWLRSARLTLQQTVSPDPARVLLKGAAALKPSRATSCFREAQPAATAATASAHKHRCIVVVISELGISTSGSAVGAHSPEGGKPRAAPEFPDSDIPENQCVG